VHPHDDACMAVSYLHARGFERIQCLSVAALLAMEPKKPLPVVAKPLPVAPKPRPAAAVRSPQPVAASAAKRSVCFLSVSSFYVDTSIVSLRVCLIPVSLICKHFPTAFLLLRAPSSHVALPTTHPADRSLVPPLPLMNLNRTTTFKALGSPFTFTHSPCLLYVY
jgi:hypothetical protein